MPNKALARRARRAAKNTRSKWTTKRRGSNSTDSSGHRKLAKWASQTAGSILGSYAGPVGAFVGEAAGGALVDYAYPEPTVDDAFDAAYPKKRKEMGGTYKGNFPYSRKAKNTWDDITMKKGYHITTETYGSVTDANAVYLQHSTWDSDSYAYAFCGAALRKAFGIAGIPINDRSEIIPLAGTLVAQDFVLSYVTQNPISGAIATVSYNTISTDTLNSIIETGFVAMKTQLINYFNDNTDELPFALLVYGLDVGQLTPTRLSENRLRARLDLTSEVVSFTSVSDLKCQNRTAADVAGSVVLETDRVDAQPLYGSIYEFNGDPKLKQVSINSANYLKLQGVPSVGIKLIRAQDFTSNTFESRPSAKIWTNCISRSNVVLNPGNIKKGACYIHMSGKMIKLFPKMRAEGSTTILFDVRCKSQLYIFEEVIRSVSTNQIKVQYERKHRVGCTLRTVKHDVPLATVLETAQLDL